MAKPTKDELRAALDDKGVEYDESDTNAELEEKLRQANERDGEGVNEVPAERVDVVGPEDENQGGINETQPQSDDQAKSNPEVPSSQDVGDVQAGAADTTPADEAGLTSTEEGRSVAQEGNQQVQDLMDAEQDAGFRGFSPDPTPLRNYTLQGQTEGAPTPETDPDLADAAHRGAFGDARTQRFPTAEDKGPALQGTPIPDQGGERGAFAGPEGERVTQDDDAQDPNQPGLQTTDDGS